MELFDFDPSHRGAGRFNAFFWPPQNWYFESEPTGFSGSYASPLTTDIRIDIAKNPGDGGGENTVSPVTVTAPSYSPDATISSTFDATMTASAAGAASGGNVTQVIWQEHEVVAANYIHNHVKVKADMNDPTQKAIANKYMSEIYADIFNALQNFGTRYTDATNPSITFTGQDVLNQMNALTWKY